MNPTVNFGPNQKVTYTRDLCILKVAGMLSDAEHNLSQLAGRPTTTAVQIATSVAQANVAVAQALMQLHDRLPAPSIGDVRPVDYLPERPK